MLEFTFCNLFNLDKDDNMQAKQNNGNERKYAMMHRILIKISSFVF